MPICIYKKQQQFMTKILISALVAAVVTGTSVYFFSNQPTKILNAQAEDASKYSTTKKIAPYHSRKGGVVVSTTSKVGEVIISQEDPSSRGKITVEISESFEASDSKIRSNGVRILLTGASNGSIFYDAPAYIDGDEIDSLIHGIAYIEKADQNPALRLRYKSQGDLLDGRETGDFQFMKQGTLDQPIFSIVVGEKAVFHLSTTNFVKVKKLLLEAKSKMDARRTTTTDLTKIDVKAR